VYYRLQAGLAQFEAQLEARRQRLSRLLARKPAGSVQEVRRHAFIQEALNSVESRSRFIDAYKAHLEAIHQELTRGTVTNIAPGVSPSDARTRGDLGDN
jgi:hypothetical protein